MAAIYICIASRLEMFLILLRLSFASLRTMSCSSTSTTISLKTSRTVSIKTESYYFSESQIILTCVLCTTWYRTYLLAFRNHFTVSRCQRGHFISILASACRPSHVTFFPSLLSLLFTSLSICHLPLPPVVDVVSCPTEGLWWSHRSDRGANGGPGGL